MGVRKDQENSDMAVESTSITNAEAALYDRQIRLWGVECQNRIRASKILIVGLNGLGVEIVKNLTLSGVNSITLMDDKVVCEKDASAQFFATGATPGQTRSQASTAAIQELNPNVKIEIESGDIESKNEEFIKNFTAVFVTECPLRVMLELNKTCRENGVLFHSGDTWGFFGYGFNDLGQHQYHREVVRKGQRSSFHEKEDFSALHACLGTKVGTGLRKKVDKTYVLMIIMNNFLQLHKTFPSPANREEHTRLLNEIRGFVTTDLKADRNIVSDEMLQCVYGELSPVCSVVGGIMANEIIKGVSKKGEPMHNFFLFDGQTCTGTVETIAIQE